MAEPVRRESAALAQHFSHQLAEDSISKIVTAEEAALAIREDQRVLGMRKDVGLVVSEAEHEARGKLHHTLSPGLGGPEVGPAGVAAADSCGVSL